MNARQRKKINDQITRRARQMLLDVRAMQKADVQTFDSYANTPNGSARLVAFHDAVLDADDTLEAVDRAIADDDLAEASKLIALGRDSLQERLAELKGLL